MKKLMQTSSQKKRTSSNLATIRVGLDKTGDIKLDLDYIKPNLFIETFKKKFPDYENSVLLSSIIYDTIFVYEDLYDRIRNTINMN
jgi:hypothetical protein|tara:strand:- start:2938 stop:3195 length:258 start_codon:yes stop_codon:yes gene_type:complete